MTRLVLTLLCGFLLLTNTAHAEENADLAVKVNSQISALSDAMLKADGETLKKLTSPDLTYGHSSGRVENQAAFIGNILNGNSHFLSIELEDQTISVIDDVAIVRHILSGDTHDKGKDPGTIRLGVMLVWHKEKGDWLLLARQAYKLPQ